MKTVLAIIMLSAFCFITDSKYNHPKSTITILTVDNINYWKKVDPVKFMDTLISYGDDYIFKIEVKPPADWYNAKCMEKLKALRNDTAYCASIITPIGEEFGEISCGSTTISQEVDHLIKGIAKKKYPLYRSSSCFYNKKDER